MLLTCSIQLNCRKARRGQRASLSVTEAEGRTYARDQVEDDREALVVGHSSREVDKVFEERLAKRVDEWSASADREGAE